MALAVTLADDRIALHLCTMVPRLQVEGDAQTSGVQAFSLETEGPDVRVKRGEGLHSVDRDVSASLSTAP